METDSLSTAEQKPPKLRWYQYRLQSLFILTILVAIASSWFGVEMRRANRQKEVVAALLKSGGTVWYNDTHGITPVAAQSSAWLQSVLGDDFCQDVLGADFCQSKVTDSDLEHLKKLKRLKWLFLGSTKITDAGLEHLKRMNQLDAIDLSDTLITDTGLEKIEGLNQLTYLDLSKTTITDSGLDNLKGLNHLRCIRLDDSQITDAGLKHLKGLKQLEILHIHNAKVTDVGIENLQNSLGNCHICN